MLKTRHQKKEANKKYQEIDKEVKQRCRQDKRNSVNELDTEAEQATCRGDIKTLYITKTLTNRRAIKTKPVKIHGDINLAIRTNGKMELAF